MKYVYCVNYDYAKAFRDETMEFSFYLKSYPTLKSGLNNLKNTNISDILGFVICMTELPENPRMLVKYINAINDIAKNHVLVLCVNDRDGLEELGQYVRSNNLKMYAVTDIDVMTDIVIRRDVFGTIIREVFKPYETSRLLEIGEIYEPEILEYSPIFPEFIHRLTEPVINAPNLIRATETDEVLDSMEDNLIGYFLRSAQINRKYGLQKDNDDEIFNGIIKDCSDGDKSLYRSIYRLIKGGDL